LKGKYGYSKIIVETDRGCSILAVITENQMSPGPVVGHLVQIVHVLFVLPHRLHLLQDLLRSAQRKPSIDKRWNLSCIKVFSPVT
jgi:hypothetical protein